MNRLFYGDNLPILRNRIKDDSVDLVYLDPPFNSNRSYNVLFKSKSGDAAQAQIEAFDDTWTWSQDSEHLFQEMVGGGAPLKVAEGLLAMRKLLGDNDVLAYIVMMTARLVELHRVLKSTGSLYLHCDPTASHYLKIMLDSIFGPTNFRSEVIWRRYGAHNDANGYGAVHDVILYYGKTRDVIFNKLFQEYTPEYIAERFRFSDPDGRRWSEQNLSSPNPRPNLTYPFTAANGVTYAPPVNGWKCTPERMQTLDDKGALHYPAKVGGRLRLKNYLDEMPGVPVQDLWTDIGSIGGTSPERLGYPTQKPVALLERIIGASSNPGDVVLDPFCGCGTAVDAAQKLGRTWIGIDITYLSIDLIQKRLLATYGDKIKGTYITDGVPREMEGAQAMFDKNPFDFERWAVSMVNGQPNQKQVGDKGIDGVIRFPLSKTEFGGAIVSVKGGASLNPAMVQSLAGAVSQHGAEMGVFVCLGKPTKGMIEAANHSGSYTYDFTGNVYPRVQIITIAELLAGKKPNMPLSVNPYRKAKINPGDQLSILDAAE